MSALRSRIIRLAHEHPDLRPHLLPLVSDKYVAKTAGRDTADFVAWTLATQKPIPTSRVIDFLERHGVDLSVRSESKRGVPLAEGEWVEVQANNAPGDLQDLLQPFHLVKGTIDKVEGNDVVVSFDNGKKLRVPGGTESGKASGLYRTSVLDTAKGMAHVEVVYLAANEHPPTQVQLEVVKQYVDRGMSQGEDRAEIYYTGYVPSYMVSKEGKPYFMMWSQQRGGRPRALSPDKGTVLYIGLVGRRPGSWVAEFDRLDAAQAV